MDNLQKMELSSSPESKQSRFKRNSMKKFKFNFKFSRKKLFSTAGIIIGVLVLLGVLSIFTIVLPAQKTYKSAMETKAAAQKAWAALKMQNVELAGTELINTRKELEETQKDLHKLSFLKYIPLANNYYNDADHLVNAGFHGISSAQTLVDSIKPYTDILGLKGQGSFVMGSAEERIQVAVKTMGKITPRIDDIAKDLVLARKEIDEVDPDHYPSIFGGEKIKAQLEMLQLYVDQGVTFVDEARPLIKVLPSLLGEEKEKRYLILFQNDKELRPTGGFITAYAVFRIDKGKITVERSDDIYTLDNSISGKPTPPEPILDYLPKVNTFNLRDSNLSPDFIESMKTFNSLYEKASGAEEVDGIIALDTHILVSTIKILDDEVFAGGIRFTSKEDDRCKCPQVIYELEDNISRPVNYVREGRKDLLGTLMFAIMEKALKASPKVYWGPLIQDVVNKTNEKHILFYIYDKNAQAGIEALNAAGRIKPFEGDYFHLNETNFGGAKANLFVTEELEQSYEVKSDGTITKTITVTYKNPSPPSDCDLESGGLCLNAPYRDWFRIYAPKGSKLISSKGSEVKVTPGEDLGKTTFEGFLTVKPLGKATLTVTYELPFKLEKNSPLPVLIQKQPGTPGFEYTIKVNGKTREKFPLLTDKKLTLKI